MTVLPSFALQPLPLLIKWAALTPLVFLAAPALGYDFSGTTVNLNQASNQEAWIVRGAGTLNAEGARMLTVDAYGASRLVFKSSIVGGRGVGVREGGHIEMLGGRVNSTSQGVGLHGNSTGSLTDVEITAGSAGLSVASEASLYALRVNSTGGSSGLQIAAGDALVVDSTLTGGVGVALQDDLTGIAVPGRLTLNNTRVEGINGAAIQVQQLDAGAPVIAEVTVGTGTELIGSNGVMLNVNRAEADITLNVLGNRDLLSGHIVVSEGRVGLNMLDSSITGDLQASAGATLDTVMQNSTLSGDVLLDTTSQASLTLVQNSQWVGNASLDSASTLDLQMDHSQFTGDIDILGASTVTALAVDSQLAGNFNADGSSTLDLKLGQSQFTGDVNSSGGSIVTALAVGSQLTGNFTAEGASTLDLQLGQSQFTGDIVSREGSTVGVAAEGSVLTGNVLVAADSSLDLALSQSQMTGDVLAEAGADMALSLSNGSVLTGRLENVDTLALNSGAQWNMTADNSVGELNMDGGRINFGDASQFLTLNASSLAGNGTFAMDVDFPSGQHDFLNIEGNATGSHELLIASTGADPVFDTSLHLVHADTGDAEFGLVGGDVDFGTWSYGLVKDGNDWFLDANHKTISPGTESVLALFNAGPTVWYGELSTLRTRMGELRLNGGQSGAWMRGYGNKFNVATENGLGYKQTQQGFSLGADAPLPWGDGQWLVGVMAGHSDSDLSMRRGTSATVKSNYVGAYATWLDADTGYYFDGVVKANRFNNDSKVNLSDGKRAKGDYDNTGVGGSLEFGKHIALGNGYFVEPYTQVSAVAIEGKDYTLDNGMRAEGEATRSLLGKLGATAGRTFDLGEGAYAQPYVRAAYAHEFAKSNTVQVNDNSFNNDLSGSRGELGTGIAVSMNDKWQVHADFDYANGDSIEQPWGASVGLRYSW
jgi:outer membrane autotransporter protein